MDYFNDPHYSAQTWWKLWPHNDHRVYATDRPLDSKSIYLVFQILFLSRPLTNSLTLGGCGSNFQSIIFKRIIQNRSISTRCEIALTRIPQNLTDQSTGPGNGLVRHRQHAITGANVDPDVCFHMSSPGQYEPCRVCHHSTIYTQRSGA